MSGNDAVTANGNKEKLKVLCVVGPTASGKTRLGVELALKYGGEVVSADSMQIYKGMHIASAAPDADEMRGVPHHLIEFLEPDAVFTVADYVALAHRTIADIAARGRLPVIVGGTGLYVNSLIDNIRFTPAETDHLLRRRLTEELETLGAGHMLERLAEIDPYAAGRLKPGDARRIIRALEIYETTGLTPTRLNELSRLEESPYAPVMIGLTFRDRGLLYGRIDRRVDIMLGAGLAEEAAAALSRETGGGMQAIGHKELSGYLRGECTIEQSVECLRRATRRYAKRQLTWFRKDGRIRWIYADETPDVTARAAELIEKEDSL